MKVYSGKNRGRMEVERLRERLIRELKEGGEVRRGKGRKRTHKTENTMQESKSCEVQIRLRQRLQYFSG